MYYPYRKGYSVLPALAKLEEPPFCVDNQLSHYVEEKHKALESQQVFLEHDVDPRIYEAFSEFIIEHGPDHIQPPYTLDSVAMQVQEDIAIHRIKDGKDWLAATHVSFPSGWRPEEKIGRPLSEIHAPIPGMNLDASYKLVETMVNHGPFVRFVWSPIYEKKINFHPDRPKKEFNPAFPIVYVKVERQITWGIPKFGAAFFILRQYIVEPDMPSLYKACSDMNDAQRKYKGVSQQMVDHLEKTMW